MKKITKLSLINTFKYVTAILKNFYCYFVKVSIFMNIWMTGKNLKKLLWKKLKISIVIWLWKKLKTWLQSCKKSLGYFQYKKSCWASWPFCAKLYFVISWCFRERGFKIYDLHAYHFYFSPGLSRILALKGKSRVRTVSGYCHVLAD